MVSESDLGSPEAECSWPRAHEVATEKMLAALQAGTISEADFVEWMCLRLRVAEARGGEATA